MKEFLKDNIALVAAIALPALLAVVFGLSTLFINSSVEDPKHDFIIVTDYYEGSSGFRFNTANEKFTVSYVAPQKDAQGNPISYSNNARLWRVHVPEMSVEEISLVEPTNKSSQNISIADLTDTKVQNITPGPDGYQFVVNAYGYNGNIMTELFSGARNYYDKFGLEKNGRFVPVKFSSSNGYSPQFLGWIIE